MNTYQTEPLKRSILITKTITIAIKGSKVNPQFLKLGQVPWVKKIKYWHCNTVAVTRSVRTKCNSTNSFILFSSDFFVAFIVLGVGTYCVAEWLAGFLRGESALIFIL